MICFNRGEQINNRDKTKVIIFNSSSQGEISGATTANTSKKKFGAGIISQEVKKRLIQLRTNIRIFFKENRLFLFL